MTLNSLEGKVRMDWGRDESELVWKAKVGDLSAFDVLVWRYRPAAVLTARGILPTRELADDAVQDAFISAYKSLPQLEDATRFGSWISAIVRYRALREHGFWGVRTTRDGERVLTARGDQAVRLFLSDGSRILIGTQRADDLAATIKSEMKV